ncbi:MAG: glycosyl hydrolase 115 family protein, partial [Clostridia bacterium]|nr:glycosyl hydrolase 115 family protein [Clostridia bacterium]
MILTKNTKIIYNGAEKAVLNGVNILSRDIDKKFADTDAAENKIILTENSSLGAEEFLLDVDYDITVSAADDLGFVYGLLYISEKFLGIEPFWFWFDQKIEKVNSAEVTRGLYKSRKPAVKYRGWFINDEVLIMKWAVNGDSEEPWRMALEALLRCGGNMVIPGTDKNSRIHRQTAVDMGLWITHHHAEPLGAEMFARVYPDLEPNYLEYSDLFMKLWEESVIEQKDDKTIWCLGFRGQGDCPFWSHDTSGRFDTDEKRGKLISDVIELQRQLVLKYVDNPVFCTNLYGEIMELYEAGHITFAPDIIKISADNGFGKMVTRRRDGHTVRISSMPEKPVEHGGIYYHVSFYDLQAANHITMFPNSVAFADSELSEVIDKNMSDYWLINCSNVRPHAYFLDVVRRKWYGEDISDELCSKQFADTYFGGNEDIADLYRDYNKYMTPFGTNEDEHAGEQFYTELPRIIINAVYKNLDTGHGLDWISGKKPIREQVKIYSGIIKNNLDNLTALYNRCKNV